MRLGVVILAHDHLYRTGQLARHLVERGARVAIHIDARTHPAKAAYLHRRLDGLKEVLFTPRVACDWGTFSLVDAALHGLRALEDGFPNIGHVALISGSCLPIRPVEELTRFLAARPDTDFIESVAARRDAWVAGGLSLERMTLYHPFSWRRRRWLFDRSVALQRRLGVRRRLPEGLEPHLGSQWWCLSRRTIRAILDDPLLPAYTRFFRTTWIPDESFLQSLARKHSKNIESRSLTFSRFDHQGKPYIFYDDHAEFLEQTDAFFARKIWPEANHLYGRYLAKDRRAERSPTFDPRAMEDRFREVQRARTEGAPGVVNAGRFPRPTRHRRPETPRPYAVAVGHGALFPGIAAWLSGETGALVHGHLFHPDGPRFAPGARTGGWTEAPGPRDYQPEQFLASLLRADPRPQAFLLAPADAPRIARFVARDPNARVAVIAGAWALGLAALPDGALKAQGLRHAMAEAKLLAELDPARVVALSDAASAPGAALAALRGAIAPTAPGPVALPAMAALPDLARLSARLRDLGVPAPVAPAAPPAALRAAQ